MKNDYYLASNGWKTYYINTKTGKEKSKLNKRDITNTGVFGVFKEMGGVEAIRTKLKEE